MMPFFSGGSGGSRDSANQKESAATNTNSDWMNEIASNSNDDGVIDANGSDINKNNESIMDIELDESKEPTADNEKMAADAEEDDDTDTSTTTVVNKSSPTKNVGGESAEVPQPVTKHTRMGEGDNHNENAVEIGSSGSITQQHNHSSFFSTKPTLFRNKNKKQDEFVKNGARVKTLVTSTLRAMADGLASNNIEGGLDSSGEDGKGDDTKNSQQRKSTKTELTHARELAQGKTEECMALKRVRFVILLLQYLL